jgi:RNA-directed DNA polymerase
MMNGRGKSDSAIVAERPTNKAGQPAEEPEERRAETEGNAVQQSTRRAQNRESVSQALDRIRQAARQRKKEKFTALLHHISPEHLEAAFFELKENAAPGVDGLTWRAYEEGLDAKILDLHSRLHKGAYRALPSRRIYIPKPDGRQRPLAVAALGDARQIAKRNCAHTWRECHDLAPVAQGAAWASARIGGDPRGERARSHRRRR